MKTRTHDLRRVLFFDLQTEPHYEDYYTLDTTGQMFWTEKVEQLTGSIASEPAISDMYAAKAGVYAEFSKIKSIACAIVVENEVRLKVFSAENETDLLKQFSAMITQHFNPLSDYVLCGHHIREFDVPFLCRRMIANDVRLEELLSISGKKPWQVTGLYDVHEKWRFGDYKRFTPLALMHYALGLKQIVHPEVETEGVQEILDIIQIFLKLEGIAEPENLEVKLIQMDHQPVV